MKAFVSAMVLATSVLAWAGTSNVPAIPAPHTSSVAISGEVLEVREVESYTYLRLKTKEGETWAAVDKVSVKLGAVITIEDVMVMKDFESKSLKRTFPTIVFGSLAGAGGGRAANTVPMAHFGGGKAVDLGDIRVSRATGANARTVAEIVTGADGLKDKPVLVRGKVVKYNPGIMGKNWIHLRDGTGSADDNSNDILVTSSSAAKLGEIYTVKGVVRVNKDFGSGYSYKVLVEEATLQQ